jgi:hypothetical protein
MLNDHFGWQQQQPQLLNQRKRRRRKIRYAKFSWMKSLEKSFIKEKSEICYSY